MRPRLDTEQNLGLLQWQASKYHHHQQTVTTHSPRGTTKAFPLDSILGVVVREEAEAEPSVDMLPPPVAANIAAEIDPVLRAATKLVCHRRT